MLEDMAFVRCGERRQCEALPGFLRQHVAFAALTMNKDLGLSSYVFGLGAGAFFWGYFILRVQMLILQPSIPNKIWPISRCDASGAVAMSLPARARVSATRRQGVPLSRAV